MKKVLSFLAVALIAIAFVAGVANANEKKNIVLSDEINVKTSVFSWMCKNKIETSIQKLDGVMDCDVDLDTKTATIKLDPENITPSEILQEIEDMGYDAKLESVKDK